METVVWLDHPGALTAARIGGKAAALARLNGVGFAVPRAFAIPVHTTERMSGDPRGWPGDIRERLIEALHALVPDGAPVAVRSSAVDEDSAAASYAGQHRSVLDVTGETEFLDAVAACLESLHS